MTRPASPAAASMRDSRRTLSTDWMGVKQGNGAAHLVGLEMADEVKAGQRLRPLHPAELGLRLLYEVLAQVAYAKLDGAQRPVALDRLARAQQRHVLRVAAGALRGARDTLSQRADAAAYLVVLSVQFRLLRGCATVVLGDGALRNQDQFARGQAALQLPVRLGRVAQREAGVDSHVQRARLHPAEHVTRAAGEAPHGWRCTSRAMGE